MATRTVKAKPTGPTLTGKDWRVDVLRSLNAPVTAANLRFLTNWQRHEGGMTNNNAKWNWLNTTSGSQYPSINSVGVRAFPDYATGIAYTAGTINNGRYSSVVSGLRAGNPYSPTLRQGILGDLSTWVSGSRSGGLSYAASVLGGSATQTIGQAGGGKVTIDTANKESSGAGAGAARLVWDESKREWKLVGYGAGKTATVLGWIPGVGPTLAKPFEGLSSVGAAGGPLGIGGDIFGWVKSNWDRVLEVVAGAIMILVGVLLLGKNLIGVTPGGSIAKRVSQADPLEEAYSAGEAQGMAAGARSAGRREGRAKFTRANTSQNAPTASGDAIPY